MEHHYELACAEYGRSPLAHDEWLAWNEATWGLRAHRVRYTDGDKELPVLEGVLYLDKRGRVRMPPITPYLPFVFTPTAASRRDRVYRQWLTVGGQLADELARRGIAGRVALSPNIFDARPFQWAGMNVEPRYTFGGVLPHPASAMNGDVRSKIRKAERAGYTAERSKDWEAIAECVGDTAREKALKHTLGAAELAGAADALGAETLRGYLVRGPSGEPASAGVSLHHPGETAIALVMGTRREHLRHGAAQMIHRLTIDDLTEAGARHFEYAGGSVEAVAASKADSGMPLLPFLVLSAPDTTSLGRSVRAMWRWRTGSSRRP